MAERNSYDVDEHLLTPEEVAARYGVAINWAQPGQSQGLTAAQVAQLRVKHGSNRLTPPAETPEWLKLLRQFLNPLMLLLVVAGALTYMAYALQPVKDKNNLILASALIIVVTATCVMSYFQERSASSLMASLSKMMPSKCTVIRDGMEQKVDAPDLVPGDFVRLYIGDRIPADIRIVETYDLKVECSSLTGESDLVPASVTKKHDLPAEARNLIFMSSLAMNGEGRGIVIRTGDAGRLPPRARCWPAARPPAPPAAKRAGLGPARGAPWGLTPPPPDAAAASPPPPPPPPGDHTMIGKIANLASGTSGHTSSLQVEVHRLVKFVAILAFCTGITLFAIGLGRKMSAIDAFVNGFILVIVANVPEGLPATVTSCLALTAVRLKERQVLIKRTDIIENLGCATIIASDKTGTLTQNKMSVENMWCNCELHNASGFMPPPPPPPPPLARSSLARMSQSLKQSIARVSYTLGRNSLAKPSISALAGMTANRKATMSGARPAPLDVAPARCCPGARAHRPGCCASMLGLYLRSSPAAAQPLSAFCSTPS
jgi:sodium/potassium-transporting ATPase subunit alpha